MTVFDYDLLCIGSGPAGQRAAVQAAKLGKRTAVIAPFQAYSLTTVAGNSRQQDTTKTQLTSNIDEIATFFSGINPHLSKEAVRSLFATHVDHHVAQITKFQEGYYANEEETWPAMEHHVYVIADTLAAAVVKQFPTKFS